MVMSDNEILSWFAKIVEECTGVPAADVTNESDMADDLNISSLAMVEVIVSAEQKFNIEISDEALRDLRTVKDMVSFLQREAHSGDDLRSPGGAATESAAT